MIKYLDSSASGLTSRGERIAANRSIKSERYDQQRHLLQALVDSDLMDLFAAAMREKLLSCCSLWTTSRSSISSVRTRRLVGDLILVPNLFEKCQPTAIHEFIKDQEDTASTGVVTIDPQVFHLLQVEPLVRQLVEKLLPSEFLSKLAVRHKDVERGHMSFIRLITHVFGDVRHHPGPAVTAARDRLRQSGNECEAVRTDEVARDKPSSRGSVHLLLEQVQ